MDDWVCVVMRVDKHTDARIIWKVVANRELAEEYYDDEDYRYCYEEWRVTGRRL